MIGDLLNNNKRKDVKTREDQVMFCGRKYRQDKKTGYYVCTTGKKRQRLHVAMWEAEAGVAVPPGCVIHHVDWVKTNNEIFNLVCVTVSEHERIHNATDAQIRAGVGGREFGEKLKKERGICVPPGLGNGA